MKKTLQDQYLLIKEGKGHKGVFLNEAKRQFPQYVPNASTFEEAVASLKTKSVISENVIGLTTVAGYEPRKKESYETAFETFLAEARKKKENEDEKVKAEEKKVSKPVEEDLSKIYDNTDEKNPDNMIFGQIMMGYYAEAKDPKNADKTMEQIKDIVFKNLAKDQIYYTKNAQFGIKDLGYTDEATALGVPKEAKGKYKSSGYGDLKESKEREELKKTIKKQVTEPSKKEKPSDKEIKDKLKKKREEELERRKKSGESLEEIKLRSVIQEMIDSELGEAYQLVNIRPQVSDKEREEREPQDFYFIYLKPSTEELMKKNQHLRVLKDPKNPEMIKGVAIRSRLIAPQNLKTLSYDINPMFTSFLNTANNIGGEVSLPTKDGVMDKYTLLNNVNVGRDGRLSFKTPNPKATPKMEGLMESVEKDLAAINKEAEHEVLQSKLSKIQDLIDKKQSQLNKLDEDEDMKSLTDDKKVKEISKDIKALEKAKIKLQKLMGKVKGKKSAPKEVIDEMEGEPSEEYLQYKEDAENRYEEGESIDSILDAYNNISLDMKNMLRNDLEGKFQGSDY